MAGGQRGVKRMSRPRKCLFLFILIGICFFTIILIFSRLSSMRTDNDPLLDPMNNPNIHVE